MKNDSKLLIHISGLQYNANINNDDNMHTDLHIPQSNYAKIQSNRNMQRKKFSNCSSSVGIHLSQKKHV